MAGSVSREIIAAVVVGAGATVVMDLWAAFQRHVFSIPSLNYAMVGRWLGHLPRGHFVHDSIGKAEPIKYEAAIGWIFHYIVGIAFALLLVFVWGEEWLTQPSFLPAAIIGIGSVVAPFFIMQPGLGAGILASRTPNPWLSRFRSIVAHTSFAIGLYLAGLLVSLMY
ncbi:hypothetical protein BJF93_23035 [Xaviernesmea oryzae]|uniref:DUF2938 domain-containing protein n=1 Tax=Xaviernesmea oryzae TaxID=464029 RepID=A0A1Q9AU00_9HYPH|nr:DUF2938 domain-containing protein [Xaviernesmea oryzae]OLP58905.1 hypothetical protein BJF93_23035 [Xaviernesmea oryzae]SEM02312.1 Protein of unknown function [Xaviernesmea oryzae]